MTPSVVGEQTKILRHDWYRELDHKQLAAYIRYQFVYLSENVIDWDSTAHSETRHVWDGGKSRDGRNYKSTWAEIIRRVTAAPQPVYPGMWVHAHFSPAAEPKLNYASGLPEITPRSLYSARSPHIYTNYVKLGPSILLHKFELALDTIKLRLQATSRLKLSDADHLMYVLCDETHVTASPFFRHVFAVRHDCETALEMYLWAAAIDYEANQPLYDSTATLSGNEQWITDPLIAAVIKIREHWRQYRG